MLLKLLRKELDNLKLDDKPNALGLDDKPNTFKRQLGSWSNQHDRILSLWQV
jgi:hypothetical protein